MLDPLAGSEPRPVVIGAGDRPESVVLAHVYAAALRAAGGSVEVVTGLGDRASVLAKLDAGDITFVPEFSGGLLGALDPDADARTPEDVYAAVSRALPQGLSVSDSAPAEVRRVLTSVEPGTVAELLPRCGATTLVTTDAWDVARAPDALADGGCRFGSVTPQGAAEAATGTVVGSTTIAEHGDLTPLEDPDYVFAAQNVVPLYRTDSLSTAQVKSLDVVAGELGTADLADMVERVRRGEIDSAAAAGDWFAARA
nr:glycine betaine ABC transporter substrate-binding protein [Rhodococcus sp. HNM0569]